MKKATPISPGKPRKFNYTYIRELYAIRCQQDCGYTKAALARELKMSLRCIRGILNLTYEKRFLALKAKRLQEQESDEDEFLPRGTLMVAWE